MSLPAALREGQALLDYDFARGIYRLRGVSQSSATGLAVTQAATTFSETATGSETSFSADTPRITNRGLLLEAAATNLFPRSAEFDNAAWTKLGSTVTADGADAPDGTTTMDKIVEGATNAAHYVQQAVAFTAAAYTIEFIFQPDGRTWAWAQHEGTSAYIFWNLSGSGAVGGSSGCTGTIRAIAGSKYRATVTLTALAATQAILVGPASADVTNVYQGDGTSGIFIGRAQATLGASPSSYIPTAAAAVERVADVATLTMPTGAKRARIFYAEGVANQAVTSGGSLDLINSTWLGKPISRILVD